MAMCFPPCPTPTERKRLDQEERMKEIQRRGAERVLRLHGIVGPHPPRARLSIERKGQQQQERQTPIPD